MIAIPICSLRAPATDDNAAAERRRRIAEMLRNGDEVMVNPNGTLHEPGRAAPDGSAGLPVGMTSSTCAAPSDEAQVELVIPTGKLAV